MSKSIYNEALDMVVDSFQDPQDEYDDCYMFNRKQMNKISKALEQAQKQEKLLKLYQELEEMFIIYIFTSFPNEELKDASWDEIILKKKQIKELENE